MTRTTEQDVPSNPHDILGFRARGVVPAPEGITDTIEQTRLCHAGPYGKIVPPGDRGGWTTDRLGVRRLEDTKPAPEPKTTSVGSPGAAKGHALLFGTQY